MISPNGIFVQHVGSMVPYRWTSWLLKFSDQTVHDEEVMPVLVSALGWSKFIEGTQVVHYTDNDSCRFAFMKGVGKTRVAKEIVAKTMELETCLQLKS